MKISDVKKICMDMSQYVEMSDDDEDMFDSGSYVITSDGTVMNRYVACVLYLFSWLSCGCYQFSYEDQATIDSLKGLFNDKMVNHLAHVDNQSLIKVMKLFTKFVAQCKGLDEARAQKARMKDNDGDDNIPSLQEGANQLVQTLKKACLANAHGTTLAAQDGVFAFKKSSTIISPDDYDGFAGAPNPKEWPPIEE